MTNLTPADLDQLAADAKQAEKNSPSPWTGNCTWGDRIPVVASDGHGVVYDDRQAMLDCDIEHIANLDPETTLALVELARKGLAAQGIGLDMEEYLKVEDMAKELRESREQIKQQSIVFGEAMAEVEHQKKELREARAEIEHWKKKAGEACLLNQTLRGCVYNELECAKVCYLAKPREKIQEAMELKNLVEKKEGKKK